MNILLLKSMLISVLTTIMNHVQTNYNFHHSSYADKIEASNKFKYFCIKSKRIKSYTIKCNNT